MRLLAGIDAKSFSHDILISLEWVSERDEKLYSTKSTKMSLFILLYAVVVVAIIVVIVVVIPFDLCHLDACFFLPLNTIHNFRMIWKFNSFLSDFAANPNPYLVSCTVLSSPMELKKARKKTHKQQQQQLTINKF